MDAKTDVCLARAFTCARELIAEARRVTQRALHRGAGSGELDRLDAALADLLRPEGVRAGPYAALVFESAVEIFVVLRLEELRLISGRFASGRTGDVTADVMDLFRAEARRLATTCVEIAELTGKTLKSDRDDAAEQRELAGVDLDEIRTTLGNEIVKLERNEATIAIIGTVKSGKSTTINAIVGAEVVPSRDQPMTTFPTLVVHCPGVKVPVLTFPLAAQFIELVADVRAEIKTRKARDRKAFDSLIASASQSEDLLGLIRDIEADNLAIVERSEGAEAMALLMSINDLTRLAHKLAVPLESVEAKHLLLKDTPSIEIEFEYLRAGLGTYSGSLALVDTPGPDEAGQSKRLSAVVAEQLQNASAIILVTRFSQLGAESTESLARLLGRLPKTAAKRLFVLMNHYDQRDRRVNRKPKEDYKAAERRTRAEHRRTAAEFVAPHCGGDPEALTAHTFPTSARHALRSTQAGRAHHAEQPLDLDEEWVMDFALLAFGESWQPEQLAEPGAVGRGIATVWESSMFDEPLREIIAKTAENASATLVESCLEKLRAHGSPLFDMLNLRASAFKQGIEQLQQVMSESEEELHRLQETELQTEAFIQEMHEQLRAITKASLKLTVTRADAYIERYFETGDPEAIASLQAPPEHSAQRALPKPRRSRGPRGPGWLKQQVGRVADAAKYRSARLFRRGDESLRRLLQRMPQFTVEKDGTKDRRIRADSEGHARMLAESIVRGVDGFYDESLRQLERILNEEFGTFATQIRTNARLSFDQNWNHFRDRLQDVFNITIDPPAFTVDLRASQTPGTPDEFVLTEQRRIFVRLEREGEGVQRWIGGLFSVLGFNTDDWGFELVATSRNDYFLNVPDIRATLATRQRKVREIVDAALAAAQQSLDEEVERYRDSLRRKIVDINSWLLAEQTARSSSAAEYADLKARVTVLSVRARNLVADATALRAAIERGAA
jgi:GTPase SAR1 family protein